MAVVKILTFEEQANQAKLLASGAVKYEDIGPSTSGVTYVDSTKPVPKLATNRFFQIDPVTLNGAGNPIQGPELNDLFANVADFIGKFFLGMSAHDTEGRVRLSVALSDTPPVGGPKYPTLNQVRVRGWEQIMVPTDPAPTAGNTQFISWDQNPIVDPRSRLALSDYLALLTALPVQLGVALPGAGRALLWNQIVPRRGLSFIVTAEFTFTASLDLP